MSVALMVAASWRLIYEVPLELVGTLLLIGLVLALRDARTGRREDLGSCLVELALAESPSD
jgi:hypothetical protein